jgi:alpha-methylacyl-CoA racemase
MPLPLQGIKVVEFAGLAPGPMIGMVLSDFGADVVRIDRVGQMINPDCLSRGKRSLAISPKDPKGLQVLRQLISQADVVIDPFRPGVLERLGLGPEDIRQGREGVPGNEGLIFSRITGFQRTGPYANMAGHDINYIALSGVLSQLGTAGGPPQPPSNILGDFAGGAMVCILGVLLALLERSKSGKGQIVEADMVTGTRYVSTFTLLSSYLTHPENGAMMNEGTNANRGQNVLDGGAPWYGVYRTRDDGWMSLGPIEPHFYAELLQLLVKKVPNEAGPDKKQQYDRSTWPSIKDYFTRVFAMHTRQEWTDHFMGTDACCVPVLNRDEAAVQGVTPGVSEESVKDGDVIVPFPAPNLTRTPGIAPHGSVLLQGDKDEGAQILLTPGEHTNEILSTWGKLKDGQIRQLWKDGVVGGPDALEERSSKL